MRSLDEREMATLRSTQAFPPAFPQAVPPLPSLPPYWLQQLLAHPMPPPMLLPMVYPGMPPQQLPTAQQHQSTVAFPQSFSPSLFLGGLELFCPSVFVSGLPTTPTSQPMPEQPPVVVRQVHAVGTRTPFRPRELFPPHIGDDGCNEMARLTLRRRRIGRFRHNIDDPWPSVPPSDVGACDVVCDHCHALRWKGETKGMCCRNGAVLLPPLTEPPAPLCHC